MSGVCVHPIKFFVRWCRRVPGTSCLRVVAVETCAVCGPASGAQRRGSEQQRPPALRIVGGRQL
jgi:hypothetical protein